MIELVVVIVVVSILAAVALERLLYYQETAEKAAMEYQANALRSAVRMQVAELMVRGRMRDVSLLAGSNPILLLEDLPQNYIADPPPGPSAELDGYWFFDQRSKEVVYQVQRGRYFASQGRDARKQVRYRVVLMYPIKVPQQDAVIVQGARLELARPYRWF